ncbi:asparagine-tRNA ligase [Aureococcus anophagefferens]|nr:asparagine-tRNA ligase [Aureococcus anophagefferens]
MFRVTSLSGDALAKAATKENGFEDDFFARSAFLTVSGQLSAETYACAMGDVYTFGPTFRAENSQTSRHLAEFWMIEPEMAFATITEAMDNAEALLKSTIARPTAARTSSSATSSTATRSCWTASRPSPRARPSCASSTPTPSTCSGGDRQDPSKWQFPDAEFGTDLATEHERWLAETHCGGNCVFVYDYPRTIKSFYMRDNDDGETVAPSTSSPGVGELVGGSQREERTDKLEAKMVEFGLDPEDYWWYLDLRKYGPCPTRLGPASTARLLRAAIGTSATDPYPRYPGSATF